MRYKNKYKKRYVLYFTYLFTLISLAFIVVCSNKKSNLVASNINTVKSITTSSFLRFEELELEKNTEEQENFIEYIDVSTLNDIENMKGQKMRFVGTLTGYGPDCPGCSGIVACQPHPNVLNNNIYYTDDSYGKIRILAADKKIPCGSIIKIENYMSEPFLGIVLDRGRDIQGMTMDLLYESEHTSSDLGRKYNIIFNIERVGF